VTSAGLILCGTWRAGGWLCPPLVRATGHLHYLQSACNQKVFTNNRLQAMQVIQAFLQYFSMCLPSFCFKKSLAFLPALPAMTEEGEYKDKI